MQKINNSKTSFMNNVGIILMSQLIVKIWGLVYRMVITNIKGFGDLGNGFYTTGFQIYTLLLAISSVGIPNAISKMISERTALEDYKGANKIFKTALMLFTVIGLVCSVLLYSLAGVISDRVIHIPGTKYTIQSLAPSIFFVCLSSVVRGYFTGLKNMKATSNSQILEQFFKSSLTILFVVLAVGQPPEIMSAAANLATSVATILSFLYLIYFYKKNRPVFEKSNSSNTVKNLSALKLAKSILMLSVPISLGSVITAINRVIDTATISRGIEIAFSDMIPAFGNTAAVVNPTLSQLQQEAARLSGMLSKSDTLINMPLALNIAFSTVLVPAVSRALALNDKKGAVSKMNYSFLISIILILPCVMGFIVLAEPIYKLIYPNAALGYNLLQCSAIALIFTALNQTISGSLQGIGKVYVPAIGILAGCIAKIILNVLLIRIPSVNIYGAVISSVVCQIISFTISFSVLNKNVELNLNMKKYVAKPVLATIIMGLVAYLSYNGLILVLKNNVISVLGSVCISAVFYIVIILKLSVMTNDEIKQLPAGNALLGMFQKLRLVK